LTSVGLRIKPASVNLGRYQIKLLGHIVTPVGIGIDPEKQEMILNWKYPTTGAALQSFLGLGTYLRDHVRYYADLTAPFEKIKGRKEIEWTEDLKHKFDTVKRAFSTAPFLVFPDPKKRFVVACDASQSGIGGILYQPETDDDNDTVTPNNIVAIYSRQLKLHEYRYPIYKKELLGLIMCLRKFHTYIQCCSKVTVLTDHKPLIHIVNQQQLSVALQQWLDVLLNYDLVIKYRPGILHIIPDALSRMYMSAYDRHDTVWGTINNIKILDKFAAHSTPSDVLCAESIRDIKVATNVKPRHRFNNSVPRTGEGEGDVPSMNEVMLHIDDEDVVDSMNACSYAPLYALVDDAPAQCCKKNVMFTNIGTGLTDYIRKVLDEEKGLVLDARVLTAEEKLLLAQEKRNRVVPDAEQQQKLISEAHALGHFGEKAMYSYVDQKGYWWSTLRSDITKEIAQCQACQRFSIKQAGYAPAQSIHAATPSEHYQIDLMSMPDSLDGYSYCLVCVDVFTGFVMLEPLKNKEAASVARALWKICSIIGLPRILQSDNGKEFVNKTLNALCRLTGVSRRYIAPYNPRADGKVERSIKEIKNVLKKMMYGTSVMWPLYVPFVQFAYNNKIRELTGSSPFALMYGRQPNDIRDYTNEPVRAFDYDDWKQHQERVVSLILPAIDDRILGKQSDIRKKIDKIRKHVVKDELLPGTLVMIKDPLYLLQPHVRPTVEPPFIGPYTVVKRTLHGPYVLRDDTGEVYKRQVPIDQMKILFSANDKQADVEEAYDIDYIMKHEEVDGEMKYLIKWKGYDVKEASWEPEENINDIASVERYFRLVMAKQTAAATKKNKNNNTNNNNKHNTNRKSSRKKRTAAYHNIILYMCM
jgi:hypothetical protein